MQDIWPARYQPTCRPLFLHECRARLASKAGEAGISRTGGGFAQSFGRSGGQSAKTADLIKTPLIGSL
jgi:hypothetical protein